MQVGWGKSPPRVVRIVGRQDGGAACVFALGFNAVRIKCLCFVAVWFWVRALRYTGFLLGCCALARAALVVAVVVD